MGGERHILPSFSQGGWATAVQITWKFKEMEEGREIKKWWQAEMKNKIYDTNKCQLPSSHPLCRN